MLDKKTIKGIVFTTWVGLVINVVLATFKIIAGIVGNSYAVLADGFHSLSDLVTDLALLVGVRYWSSPPDENHPYGHQRLEHIISLLIAVVLALTGIGIAYTSINNYLNEKELLTGKIAVIAALLSIVIKEALYHWTVFQGRKYHSSAVIANAWHHRSDAFSSIPAAIAAAATMIDPALVIADLIGSIIVALFIVGAAWKIAVPAANILMDGSAGREERKEILRTVIKVPGVKNVHKLRTRFLGHGLDVNMHVKVSGDISVYEGHEIATAVENALYALGPKIGHVTVHIEPWFAPQAGECGLSRRGL